MWARHMELALGLWMLGSPFILGSAATWRWIHDFAFAAVMIVVPLLAHWAPARFANLALLPVAGWLMVAGWWAGWSTTAGTGSYPDPAYQNWIMVGLTLAMLAVVPSEAEKPPVPWRAHGE